jgi:hypothetical protein
VTSLGEPDRVVIMLTGASGSADGDAGEESEA